MKDERTIARIGEDVAKEIGVEANPISGEYYISLEHAGLLYPEELDFIDATDEDDRMPVIPTKPIIRPKKT